MIRAALVAVILSGAAIAHADDLPKHGDSMSSGQAPVRTTSVDDAVSCT